jgi:hypothetical protein
MKRLNAVALAATAFFYLVTAASAGETPGSRCIELWPDFRNFHSVLPDASRVRATTEEELTGMVAHVAAYVERREVGRVTFDPVPQQMFIFSTTNGRYVVRFVDGESVPGWYYGWHAPF